jgi:hypothetical protein
MNWKGYGRKRTWYNIRQYPVTCLGLKTVFLHCENVYTSVSSGHVKESYGSIYVPVKITSMINILGIFVETGKGSQFSLDYNFALRNSLVFFLSGKVEHRKVITQKTMETLTSIETMANKESQVNLRLIKKKLSYCHYILKLL